MTNAPHYDQAIFTAAREYQEELLRLVAGLVVRYARCGRRVLPWIQPRLAYIYRCGFYEDSSYLLTTGQLFPLENLVFDSEWAFKRVEFTDKDSDDFVELMITKIY